MDSSTINNHWYNWSCNPECLFYKSEPICFKLYGLILTKEENSSLVYQYFSDLEITSYTYEQSPCEVISSFKSAIKLFANSILYGKEIDHLVLNLIKETDCIFENKFFNFCKKQQLDDLLKIIDKRLKRRSQRSSQSESKTLTGLWYGNSSTDEDEY